MKAKIKTIAELLVTLGGSQKAVAKLLKASPATVRKYTLDVHAQQHAVVNGILMTHPGHSGKYKGKSDREARQAPP